jgi:hypothetical protein
MINLNLKINKQEFKKKLNIRDGINGLPGKDGVDGIGIPGTPGIDGKDGSPDTPEQVKDKLSSLKGDERLDKSAIKGIDELLKEVKHNFNAGRGTSPGGTGRTFDSIVRDQQVSIGLTYNIDGTLATATTSLGARTFSYSNGVLISMTGDGVYKSKSFLYNTQGQLTDSIL